MTFQIHALPEALFADLFALDADALAARHARRIVVDAAPGYPCRVSLEDAAVGETVTAVNFLHQPAPGPYRASHAVFVRERARQARPAPGEVPDVLRKRLLSLRAFDADHAMIDADVVEGAAAADGVARLFENPRAAYLHIHNARPGCYAARATRA